MRKLIAVANTNAGILSAFGSFFGRMLGSQKCALSRISHSGFGVSSAWRDLTVRVGEELGYDLVLVAKNRRTDAQLSASAGREPCVLIEGENDDLAMIMDWSDLKLAKGNVDAFERILRAKLLMY